MCWSLSLVFARNVVKTRQNIFDGIKPQQLIHLFYALDCLTDHYCKSVREIPFAKQNKKNNYNFNSVCCVRYQKQPYSNLPNAKNNGMNLTILLTLALRTRQFWIVNLIC